MMTTMMPQQRNMYLDYPYSYSYNYTEKPYYDIESGTSMKSHGCFIEDEQFSKKEKDVNMYKHCNSGKRIIKKISRNDKGLLYNYTYEINSEDEC